MDKGAAKPKVVLIADDDAKVRSLVQTVLTQVGLKVLQASNGREAILQVSEHLPDVVLLDIVMPDLTGIRACQELKNDKRTRNIPIIICSGLDAREALEQSIIAGAEDFLAKPIDSLELLVRVRSMLHARKITAPDKRIEAYIKNLQALRRA